MKSKFMQPVARVRAFLAGFLVAGASVCGTVNAQPVSVSPGPSHPVAIAKPCYGPGDGIPPVQLLTVVLIDRTAPKQGAAWRDFNAAAQAAIGQTGQRVVVLPFAGLAPGQTLSRALDAVIEPPVSEEARQDMVIANFKRLQGCVGKRQTQIKQTMGALLDRLGQEDPAPLARSEVLYALEATLSEFAGGGAQPLQHLRLMVYSDGLQNGSGLNFYAQGAARSIQPEQELKRWKPSAAVVNNPNARVWWWGLLAQGDSIAKPGAASTRYFDAQTLASYHSFWSQALARLGVSKAEIGPTLNNPDLSFPSPGP